MTVKFTYKPLTTNPLKLSQPLGGTLAFQGIFRAMPIIHGSQGCAAFIKSLMTRHYQEPISIQTSALHEMNVIFGAEGSMVEALDIVIEKHNPDIVGVFSTALTEVAGDDLITNVKHYRKKRLINDKLIVPVSLPDFSGTLESGYRKTVEAILISLFEQFSFRMPRKRYPNRITLLPGPHLTPGDVLEIKEILYSFGFNVITVPDLSTSLSGHLEGGYSPLSRGGISLEKLQLIAMSSMTIAIGTSMRGAARIIEEKTGIPYRVFPSLTGLKASDDFFAFLQAISRRPVSFRYRIQRENLLDIMLDSHFYFGGKKAVVALEPDHLFSIMELLKEVGVSIRGAVSSISTPILEEITERVKIGDFSDLECMAEGADLWVSNSHGKQGAERKKVPFVPLGFPIFERLGSALMTSVGYRGTTELLINIGNKLIEEGRGKVHENSICNR